VLFRKDVTKYANKQQGDWLVEIGVGVDAGADARLFAVKSHGKI